MKMSHDAVVAIADEAWEDFLKYANKNGAAPLLEALPDMYKALAKSAMSSGVAFGLKRGMEIERKRANDGYTVMQ